MSDAPRGRHRGLFSPITPGAARAIVALFVLSLVIGGLNFFWTSRVAGGIGHRAQALCRFDSDLGGVPVAVNPSTGKATLLSVSIISDARIAWRTAACPGRLPPPDPTLVKWAKFYKLPTG